MKIVVAEADWTIPPTSLLCLTWRRTDFQMSGVQGVAVGAEQTSRRLGRNKATPCHSTPIEATPLARNVFFQLLLYFSCIQDKDDKPATSRTQSRGRIPIVEGAC